MKDMFKPHETDKHKIKRNFAIVSFFALFLTLVLTFVLPFFDVSLESHTGIITTLILSFASIIGAYLGIAHMADNKKL